MKLQFDAKRRHHLLDAAVKHEQVIITTTDLDRFEPEFLKQATLFKVSQGLIEPS